MTIIAYRDGVMATDSQGTGSGIRDCTFIKIAVNERGDLCGVTGDCGFAQRCLDWFSGGEKHEYPRNGDTEGECVIVRMGGDIEIRDGGGQYNIQAPYYAAGSGRALALGALAHGATAEESVKAAIVHDVNSGGKIRTLKHEDK